LKLTIKTYFLILSLLINTSEIYSQSVSNDMVKESFRNEQLLNHYAPNQSLCINANQVSLHDLDSALGFDRRSKTLRFTRKNLVIGFMPVSLTNLYNSQTPYDWNLGSMIPARGYQAMVSLGVYAQIGKHFTIQVAPEIVSAQNSYFQTFPQELGTAVWASYYRFLNTSDIPERFGNGVYHKLFAGQSSIRYNTKSLSLGISTENLWWGPGYRNALIMSTNAPGFLHGTLETRKPIVTGIGDFEGQVIAGDLENSGILPPRTNSVDPSGNFVYQPKPNHLRYITGMVLSWRPKWVKNLYLGFAKTSYLYAKDISNPLDALPLQGFFGDAITASERNSHKSSLGSVFVRYLMLEDHAEMYMEYGRKDQAVTLLNIIPGANMYRRAYTAGIRKLFASANKSHIQLVAELTQLEAPTAALLNNPDSWYTDQYVRQGYTNMGKVLGAGIGPGSNSQTLEISWVRGLKKIGLQFERLRHNNDFYYYGFQSIGDFRRYWTDISTTLKAQWNYHHFLFSGQLGVIRSLNYEWLVIQVDPSNYFAPSSEVLNIEGRVGVSYRF